MTDYTTMTNDELSAEIARRLFGWVFTANSTAPIPYASDHNAAMGLVVPEMRKRGWHFYLDEKNGQVLASFWRWQVAPKSRIPDSNAVAPFGEEPRAICEAALAALDSEEAK